MFWKKYREEVLRLQKKQVALLQILVDARPQGYSVQTARLRQEASVFEKEKQDQPR